jgi:hypothetical protein
MPGEERAVRYCPDCRSEYQPWVAACLDCGAPLVDALPPLPERPAPVPVHEVAVGRYASGTEAAMWAEVLAGEGIPSVAAAMGPGTAYLGSAAVPHELRVRAADADRARSLLEPPGTE